MMRWSVLLLLALASLLASHADDVTTERWANGFRLTIVPTTASQVVSIELLIDYAAFDEKADVQGIRQVLVTSMLQGSSDAAGSVIQQTLTALGGKMEGGVHQDMLEFRVTVPASSISVGLAALAEIVCHPKLTDDGIMQAIEHTRQLQRIPPVTALQSASVLSYTSLYAGHPFGTRALGTPDTLDQITPARVRAAYHDYVLPGAAIMAVVGRCTPDAVRGAIRSGFGLWENRPRPPRLTVANPSIEESELVLRELPVGSACIMLTFPVCGAAHPDFLPLRLLDTLLSGGTGARLFRVVREQRHLAYEVSTIFPTQRACSQFSLYALTRATTMEETRAVMTAELARLQTEPVSAEELQRAKAYLKGHYLLSHQYSAQYAFDLTWYELIGRGAGFNRAVAANIDAITPKDIQRVARTYFTHYYLIVVVPELDFTADDAVGSISNHMVNVFLTHK